MGRRFPFQGKMPSGWYVVATSEEVSRGSVRALHYFDQDLVLYRSASGVLRMADAFCPHMGAHLGRVGRVEGELLRCGFHGFCYDASGTCVATPYGGQPPRVSLRQWRLREQNGLILTWYDAADRGPDWEVPALEQKGWTPIRWRRFEINTTPQETTENSIDFGHFTQLHGFVAAEIRRPLDTDGAFLRTTYQGHRPIGLPGVRRFPIAVEYDVKVSGLGYSQVDVEIEALRLNLRLWVLPVPVDAAGIHLVLGASAPTRLGLLTYPARYTAHTMLCREVEQDLDVWNYKTFVERPALAKGDGPVAEYRKWAEQFYH